MVNAYLCIESEVYSYLFMWWTQKWLEKTKPQSDVEEIDEVGRSWRTDINFLITCSWDALNVKSNESIIEEYRRCSNHESLPEQLKSNLGKISRKNLVKTVVWSYGRSCEDMWEDTANWRIEC